MYVCMCTYNSSIFFYYNNIFIGKADGVSAINTVQGLMSVRPDATAWPSVGNIHSLLSNIYIMHVF